MNGAFPGAGRLVGCGVGDDDELVGAVDTKPAPLSRGVVGLIENERELVSLVGKPHAESGVVRMVQWQPESFVDLKWKLLPHLAESFDAEVKRRPYAAKGIGQLVDNAAENLLMGPMG